MLPKKKSYCFHLSLFTCLISLLTACSGNPTLEGKFTADPALKESPGVVSSPTPTPLDNIPAEIPRYPNAKLLTSQTGTDQQTLTRWTSSDPSNLISTYYLQQFQGNKWQVVQPFSNDSQGYSTLIARQNGLEVKITITPSSPEFTIEYKDTAKVTPSPTIPTPTPTANTPLSFSDLDQVPELLRKYVEDLATLGVLTAQNNQGQQFNPNAPINRRDFARWLFTANNKLYANSPGKQIRAGSASSQPAFGDIKSNSPDFGIIQGLAEAGLIPSSLIGDSNALLFRPDAPLTREDLIRWKVPLDTRKGLPGASLDTIKETWGFQDVTKIDPKTWRSLYADFQNGDQSNIRRVFGYTTLLQPKKPVTRAEAAAALWYFGYQGEGISAPEAKQLQNVENPS